MGSEDAERRGHRLLGRESEDEPAGVGACTARRHEKRRSPGEVPGHGLIKVAGGALEVVRVAVGGEGRGQGGIVREPLERAPRLGIGHEEPGGGVGAARAHREIRGYDQESGDEQYRDRGHQDVRSDEPGAEPEALEDGGRELHEEAPG